MKTAIECVPCFVRQALNACRVAGADDTRAEAVTRRTLAWMAEADWDCPPPVLAGEVHRLIRQTLADADPYRELKRQYNTIALEALPELETQVAAAADPFAAAVRLAIAGNIIDFGANADLREHELAPQIQETMTVELGIDDIDELRRAAASARSILYLGDNAGEIVLDIPLLKALGPQRVTFVVKGSPILNDATLEDARETGLDRLVRVIDNGVDVPGTPFERCRPEVRELFDGADLVISKGQGNYESLVDTPHPGLFFLLKVKCPIVAKLVGRPMGAVVAMRGPGV